MLDSNRRTVTCVIETATASAEQATEVAQSNLTVMQMEQVARAHTTQTETLALTARFLTTQAMPLQELAGQCTLSDSVR